MRQATIWDMDTETKTKKATRTKLEQWGSATVKMMGQVRDSSVFSSLNRLSLISSFFCFIPVMYFNATKSDQTGWYSNKVTVVTPGSDGFNGCFDDQVYRVADYSNRQNDQTFIVRVNNLSVDNYFVTYNQKMGMNLGTVSFRHKGPSC